MAIYGTLGDIEVGADYPSIQPTLDLNFAKTKALDSRITFYRNSLATYTDDRGIIRTVPENVPRFDHNPTTGESLGLLIEEGRTNLAIRSEEFESSSWDKTTYPCSITSNQLLSPSNTTTADLISSTTSNSRHAVMQFVTGATQGTTYTMSAYVKPGTQRYIIIGDQGDSLWRVATFDSNTKTIVHQSFVLSSSATDVGNGWYRLSITATRSGAAGNYVIFVGFSNSSTNTDIPTYSGSTSDNFYIWGAQVEIGSSQTSYIPTSGSAVTRAADVCYIDGTNFSSWYNPTESSIFSQFICGNNASAQNRLFRIGNSANVAINRIDYVIGSQYHPYIETNAVLQVDLDAGSLSSGVVNKIAVGLINSGSASVINGGNVATSGLITLPTTVNQIELGQHSATNFLNGTLSRFSYYPKRLTNLQLQNLTA